MDNELAYQVSSRVLKHTPCRNHVKVENGSNSSKQGASLLQSLDPAVKGEHEKKYGDGFVIIRTGNGAGYVARCDANECGSE